MNISIMKNTTSENDFFELLSNVWTQGTKNMSRKKTNPRISHSCYREKNYCLFQTLFLRNSLKL